MPSIHLILCRALLLLPPIPPSIRVFSNESTLRMRWPKYWSPHSIPQGHPSAPALSTMSHALNLDWRSVSHMIIHMFQCNSHKLSHPCLLPESKSLFFISVSLLLSRIEGLQYHLSKLHIYVLIYCIGVFLSDLLHSV